MSFQLFIRLFFVAFLLMNFLVGKRLVRWVATFGAPENRRRIRAWMWLGLAILNLPALYFIVLGLRTAGSTHQSWHLFFLYPYFAWQITALVMFILLLAKAAVTLPFRIAAWIRARRGRSTRPNGDRREFLAKAATALPAGLFLTSGYGIIRAQRDFDWFEHNLQLKDWPKELEGLRVMQISDFHVGNFLPGKKLNEYIERINEKPCDMMMITGDIINNNIAWLPECLGSLGTLKLPKYGAYVCIGNHDYYSGGAEEILAGMQKLGMTVVRDSHVTVPVRDRRLTVAGIDYPMNSGPSVGGDRFRSHVNAALAGVEPDIPVILLAHHPHAFDEAARRGVALTLAGHTHGGQFAFTYPGGTVSAGDFMFNYVAGVYKRGESYLYVNRGIGNWFPMRIGAPPEVTLLTLG